MLCSWCIPDPTIQTVKVPSIKLRTFLVKKIKISNQEVLQLLLQKRVLLNGNPANGSDSVSERDEVSVDGKIAQEKEKYTYIRFYKPRGIESTLNKNIPDNLTTVFKYPKKLFPVGRLDKESEGLMLFTDDGVFYKKVTQSNTKVEKEYLVIVDKMISDEFMESMRKGVTIMGKKTKPAIVEVTSAKNTFSIILTEGMNRQIRRMCYKLGYEVLTLIRTRIGNTNIANLKVGEWEEIIMHSQ
jgi:23S rRNA pseudouridine2604 synthase